jgi:hypothetical protein
LLGSLCSGGQTYSRLPVCTDWKPWTCLLFWFGLLVVKRGKACHLHINLYIV